MYDPVEYWAKRGRNFPQTVKSVIPRRRPEYDNLIDWVREIRPREILEVGSGWGAIYRILDDRNLANNFTMCDFVDSMRNGCLQVTGILPDYWDGKILPYADDSFDLVLNFRVLQHTLPGNIEAFIAEEARVARRWIFVASIRETNRPITLSGHIFIHNYIHFFEHRGLQLKWEKQFGEISHLLFAKPERN